MKEHDKLIDALNLIDEQAEDCLEENYHDKKKREEAYALIANFIDKHSNKIIMENETKQIPAQATLSFIEKLQLAKIEFESLEKIHKSFDKKSMPEVLVYLKQEKAKVSGGTVYNGVLAEFIVERENVPTELIDHLRTEIYLAQHDLRDEEDEAYAQEMLSKGYYPLDNHVEYRGKIELMAQKSIDWLTSKISVEAILKALPDGELFAVPKGKRSRGYYVRNLENAFYKPLN